MTGTLRFNGHQFFRQRLIMATISGKSIRIDDIRSGDNSDDEDHIGLKDYESLFLRLLDQFTNGSSIEINYTGTSVYYRPGVISGGQLEFDCGLDRSISYYLEPLIALAPFAKTSCNCILYGITNGHDELTVDLLRTATLPHYKLFGIEDGVELKIKKRGAPPLGGGEVQFRSPITRSLKPIQFVDQGRIKRIRGIAYTTRVSPQNANRMVESSRQLLNRFIPDVFIYTDVYRGAESGKSPGFGLSLVAESTSGSLVSAEIVAQAGQTPEDIGLMAAKLLYHEISLGGCVDSCNQWLVLLFMVLCPEDVSKIRLGKLSEFSMQLLREIKQIFGVTFKIKPDPESKTVLASCLGVGYVNINKKTT